jgi:hypothetical protein
VPWAASFVRNSDGQTTRVDLVPEPGHGLQAWELVPERIGGRMRSVQIVPLAA